MTNNTIFADALIHNATIKTRKSAMINGGQVGVENYAKWKTVTHNAYELFYKYQFACMHSAVTNDVNPADTTKAMNALQELLDLIGEVNGHKIIKSVDMLVIVSKYAMRDKEDLIGEALAVKSQLDNYKQEYRNIHTGMNEDYIKNLEEKIEETTAKLSALKCETDSVKIYKTRNNESTFRFNLERTLAQIINEQEAKTWEELEAEEEARKAERKAKAKSYKQAKRQAEAKAKAKANA